MERIILALILILFLLSGCGGGDGDGGIDGTGGTYIEGTAAIGEPLANTKLFVKGKLGKKIEAVTDDRGKFSVNVKQLTPPYLIKIAAGNDELFSIALKSGITNIHPLTDLVSRKLFVREAKDIENEFESDGSLAFILKQSVIDNIIAAIDKLLQAAYVNNGIPADFDFFAQPFDAEDQAFGGLLKKLKVTIEQDIVNIDLIDRGTEITANIVVNLNISIDLDQADNELPSMPTAVKSLAKSESTIIIGWDSSSDNTGIAGYYIYHDLTETLIATVAATVYVDTELEKSSEHCYAIQAFDAAENVSSKTDLFCATTLSGSDVQPPESVGEVKVVSKSVTRIDLSWAPGIKDNVLGYHVYRQMGDDSETLEKISTVVASAYVDETLVENTRYCYQVEAFNATLVTAARSVLSCAETLKVGGKPELDNDITPPNTKATPESSSNSGEITVQLTCTDENGLGCKSIYFTLDDAIAKENFIEYQTPIVINADSTLRFYSIDKADIWEDINSEEYKILPVIIEKPPETRVVPAGGVYGAAVKITLTCVVVDAANGTTNCVDSFYTFDDAAIKDAFTVYSLPIDLEATKILRYYSIDNKANSESIQSETYTINLPPDKVAPTTVARPPGKLFGQSTRVDLFCNDTGGSVCDKTYYTIDGSLPTELSEIYKAPIVIDSSATLKFFSVDQAGNAEAVLSENYEITTSTVFSLSVSLSDNSGKVTSDLEGINCGEQCSANFPINSPVILTATPSAGGKTLWRGCNVISSKQCSLKITEDTSVNVTFVPVFVEGERNDSFVEADLLEQSTSVVGYFGANNDEDYFKIVVTEYGTLFVSITHSSISSYLYLYNDTKQQVISIGPNLQQTLALSLDVGTYYLKVMSSDASFDTNIAYDLELSGTVIGNNRYDIFEPNDSFDTAEIITNSALFNAYFDTPNDTDYYQFEVASPGSFKAEISHAIVESYMYLLNGEKEEIARSGRATTHTLTQSLIPGTYYLQVISYAAEFDLENRYGLEMTGTVLGGTTRDGFEVNDSFGSAYFINEAREVNGFFDTQNDSDYFRIVTKKTGTLQLKISHDTIYSNLYLYDLFKREVVSSIRGITHSLSESVKPATTTFYVRVTPYSNDFDETNSYKLTFMGSVLNVISPDTNEPNDIIGSETIIESSGEILGYFDTRNDSDYFWFETTTAGTFQASISHVSMESELYLYRSASTSSVLALSRNKKNHSLSQTLLPGRYFFKVIPSSNAFDLESAYTLTLSGTVFGDALLDTKEPNDSFNSATAINDIRVFEGYFETQSDFDYYSFEVKAAGSFRASISHDSLSSNLTLLKAEKTVKQIAFSTGVTHTLTQSLTPGTYYIGVNHKGYDLLNAYTLTLAGTVFGDISLDTNEENDSFESAKELSGSGEYQGFLETENDFDFFTFNIPTEGSLYANMSHGLIRSDMVLYNDKKEVLSTTTGVSHALAWTLMPGKYYLSISPYNFDKSNYDLQNKYTLDLSGSGFGVASPDLFEPNNSIESAVILTSPGPHKGYIDTPNDKDFFKFEVNAAGSFGVKLNTKIYSILTLLNNENIPVIEPEGKISHVFTQSLKIGTYYLQIEAQNPSNYNFNIEDSYNLELSGTIFGITSPDAYEENNSILSAKSISSSGSFQGYFDTQNDSDYFKVELTAGGELSINLSHLQQYSSLVLLKDADNSIVQSNNARSHSLMESLTQGIYYIQIISEGRSNNLDTSYDLTLSFN